MLSPADYAAYSQATGRPYPQSDEEKANMYGEVRDFRRGQTKSDEGPGLAGGLAIGAAVLGSAVGAGALGRKLLANSKRAQARVVPKAEGASGQRGVQRGDLSDMATVRRMATTDIPQTGASNPLTDSIVQANKQGGQTNPLTQSFIADNARAGAESKAKTDVVTSGFKQFSQMADQIAGEAPQQGIVSKKITFQEAAPADERYSQQVAREAAEDKAQKFADSAKNTLVEIQERREPIVELQSVDALDTVGDQLDNKLESAIQRDTDSIIKGKEAVASEYKFTFKDLEGSNLPQSEQYERVSAAASANPAMSQMLLNPNVSTNQLKQMGALGSSMKMDKATGRVEANPTFEIKGGAGASMSDRPAKARKQVGSTFDDEGGSGYGDFYASSDGEYVDMDTNAGVEGSAYLKETEGYKERTNKGQTFLAGKVQEMTGSVPDSTRQERVLDEFVPIRQVGGEESPGYVIKPGVSQEDQFGLVSKRRVAPEGRVQAGDKGTDINVTGSKLIGNFEAPETTPFFQMDDQIGVQVSDEGFITPTIRGRSISDMKTAQTMPLTGRYSPGDDRLTTQPYMLFNTVATEAGEKSVKQPLYGPLLQTVRNEKGQRRAVPVTVSRAELSAVAQKAADDFRDPAVQRAYLGAMDPDYLATQGTGAIQTRPFDQTGFIAMELDQALKSPEGAIATGRSVELPVLSDPSAKHRFVSDITSGSYDSQQYGRTPYKKGAQAEPTGGTERKGFGGVNPMELEDASSYEGQVAFRTPRVEGGESKTPAETRPTPSALDVAGERMYALLSDHKSRTGKPLDKNNALIFAADIGRQEGVDGNQVLRAALGRTDRSVSQLQSTRRQMGEVKPSRVVYQDESRPDSIETYDVDSVMQRTMAQAGRRRGARRS